MKLKKELVDELIRVTRDLMRDLYGITYDKQVMLYIYSDISGKVRDISNDYTVDLIRDLAKFSQRSGIGTYEDIYKALAIFGVIVE